MTAKGPVFTLNNGVSMPAFGLGVFQSRPDETVEAVKIAIANGYGLIDTTAAYLNERQVGDGIRQSGVDRSQSFVTTKLWLSDYGYDQTLHALDRSMRRLQLDYLDLYLLHWPVPTDFENTVASYKAAEKLLADKRVRAIGVCNFSPKNLNNLIARSSLTPAVNQVELHPFFAQQELGEANAQLGVVTQAWSPIGGVNRYWIQTGEAPKDPLSAAQASLLRVPLADGTLVPTNELPPKEFVSSLLATSDVLGTGWFAADAANVKPGSTAVVVGDGAVGLPPASTNVSRMSKASLSGVSEPKYMVPRAIFDTAIPVFPSLR